MADEFQIWKDHFIRQAHGKMPHEKKFYNVSEQVGQGGGANIKLISPTQQMVERAKSTLSHPEDSHAPTIYDPVTGVMQNSTKEHRKVKSPRKRKYKTHSKKGAKKRRIPKKKVKKGQKNKKKKVRRKKLTKINASKNRW